MKQQPKKPTSDVRDFLIYSACMWVVFMGYLVWTIYQWYTIKQFWSQHVSTTALILNAYQRYDYLAGWPWPQYIAVYEVQYQVAATSYTNVAEMASATLLDKGQTVEVLYDPNNPSSVITSEPRTWGLITDFIIYLACVCVVTIITGLVAYRACFWNWYIKRQDEAADMHF